MDFLRSLLEQATKSILSWNDLELFIRGEQDLPEEHIREIFDWLQEAILRYSPEEFTSDNYKEDRIADIIVSTLEQLYKEGGMKRVKFVVGRTPLVEHSYPNHKNKKVRTTVKEIV